MKKLFDIIRENIEECDYSKGASDELIIMAENYLGVIFPESYKLLLKTFGYLSIGSEEIYGILGPDFENSGIPDAIWLTKQEHKNHPELKHLVFVYFTGDEFYFCLDTSRMKNGECPVVGIHVSCEGEIEDVHSSFKGLLEECIEIGLDMEFGSIREVE